MSPYLRNRRLRATLLANWPRVEVESDSKGNWYWHLQSANGRIMADAYGYNTERECWAAAERTRQAFAAMSPLV
ncbi:MAG TPA: hypothetical protein DHW63_01600 [Hyphomonadaceae bacterium]|nr:hypothetical protein [Hyphomonadaceae bacterium]